jgi:hypothetical protein
MARDTQRNDNAKQMAASAGSSSALGDSESSPATPGAEDSSTPIHRKSSRNHKQLRATAAKARCASLPRSQKVRAFLQNAIEGFAVDETELVLVSDLLMPKQRLKRQDSEQQLLLRPLKKFLDATVMPKRRPCRSSDRRGSDDEQVEAPSDPRTPRSRQPDVNSRSAKRAGLVEALQQRTRLATIGQAADAVEAAWSAQRPNVPFQDDVLLVLLSPGDPDDYIALGARRLYWLDDDVSAPTGGHRRLRGRHGLLHAIDYFESDAVQARRSAEPGLPLPAPNATFSSLTTVRVGLRAGARWPARALRCRRVPLALSLPHLASARDLRGRRRHHRPLAAAVPHEGA